MSNSLNTFGILGIDGSGKSTLALHLRQELERLNHSVSVVNWRDRFGQGKLSSGVTELHAAVHRLAWGHATPAQEGELQFPSDSSACLSCDFLDKLGEIRIAKNDSQALTMAALAEIAADVIFRKEEVALRRDPNQILVFDSFGLKPVLKILVAAQVAAEREGDPAIVNAIKKTIDLAIEIYSLCEHPSFGVVLDVNPEVAWERKTAAGDTFGLLEDLAVVGRPGLSGFVELQSRVGQLFREAASRWSWHIVREDDSPKQTARYLAERIEAGCV